MPDQRISSLWLKLDLVTADASIYLAVTLGSESLYSHPHPCSLAIFVHKMASEQDKSSGPHEEQLEQSTQNFRDAHVAIHTDTYDIDEDALGINLPKHYYMSPGFIGTVVVSLLYW